jgi:hypothetical protein
LASSWPELSGVNTDEQERAAHEISGKEISKIPQTIATEEIRQPTMGAA